MLQRIRDKAQGFIAWAIVLVVGSFIILGSLNEYFSSSKQTQVAAIVDGEKISWSAVEVVYERLRQEQGALVAAPDTEVTLKNEARKALVQRAAMVSGGKQQGFRVTNEQIIQVLKKEIPQFQVDGKFSEERFLQVLNESSYNEMALKKDLQQGILLAQLQQGIVSSSFSLPSEMNQVVQLLDQSRQFAALTVPIAQYRNKIKASDSELEQYYTANLDQFRAPERLKLEYVTLALKSLMDTVPVNDALLRNFYNDNTALYTAAEKVNARHILITVAPDATQDEQAQALTKAQSLVSRLQKGENFSELAKKESQDPGSASKGGVLGWFEKGEMIAEFEEAAFNLKAPDDLSQPIKTQFGYHIIQLIEHQPLSVSAYNEVASVVDEQYRRQQAEIQLAQKMEELGTLAFENADTLEFAAKQLGLELKETPFFDQQGADGISSHPAIIKAAFSTEVLQNKHNSEPIALDSETYAVVRLKDYTPAVVPPFKQIADKVKEHYVNLKAVEQCQEVGQSIIKRLAQGESPKSLAKAYELDLQVHEATRSNTQVPSNLLSVAFSLAPVKDKPVASGMALPTGDYVVVTLLKVKAGEIRQLNPEMQANYKQSLTNVKGELEYALYTHNLVKKAKIELKD